MRKQNLFILTVIVFLHALMLTNCGSPHIRSSIIPDSLYYFFPNGDKNLSLLYSSNNSEIVIQDLQYFDPYIIIEVYKIKDNYDETKQKYKTLANTVINSADTIYHSLESQYELEKKYSKETLLNIYKDYDEKILIYPIGERLKDFDSVLYNQKTVSNLPLNFDLYIFKSGLDNVMVSAPGSSWDILPDKLKHGYNSGVAFNDTDPYIIFWALAW